MHCVIETRKEATICPSVQTTQSIPSVYRLMRKWRLAKVKWQQWLLIQLMDFNMHQII